MEKPYFELTYLPKNTEAVESFQKMLENSDEFKKELTDILEHNRIEPTRITLKAGKHGKGNKNNMYEGFEKYQEYVAKVTGKKKSFWGGSDWNSEFNMCLLYGKRRNGLLFRAMLKNGKEVKAVAKSLHYRLLMNAAKQQGAVPWQQIVQVGN